MMTKQLGVTLALSLFLCEISHAGVTYLFSVKGDQPSDGFGSAVHAAGDVNKDGYRDIIVGAVGWDGDLPVGYARVYSGKNGSLLHSWSGFNDFGAAVAGAGDVNGDGHDDLIVGGDGSVRVYSGKSGLLLWMKTDVAGKLGWSVDGLGDVNHDGYSDIVASAPFANVNGVDGSGYVRVYNGKTGATLYTRTFGPSLQGRMGWCVSSAGDWDNDGSNDIVVGSPYDQLNIKVVVIA